MNNKYLIFLLSLLVIIAGCSSEEPLPDCTSSNTEYVQYIFDETTGSCVIFNQVEANVCGNSIKEDGETFCNCAEDVPNADLPIKDGGCSGSKGDYLEYVCSSSNICELEMNNKRTPKSFILEPKNRDITFEVKLKYNQPLIIDRESFDLEFLLKEYSELSNTVIKDIVIRKISVMTSANELVSDVTVSKKFPKQYHVEEVILDVNELTLTEFQKTLVSPELRIIVDYTKESYNSLGELIKTETPSEEFVTRFDKTLELIDSTQDFSEVEDNSNSGWS